MHLNWSTITTTTTATTTRSKQTKNASCPGETLVYGGCHKSQNSRPCSYVPHAQSVLFLKCLKLKKKLKKKEKKEKSKPFWSTLRGFPFQEWEPPFFLWAPYWCVNAICCLFVTRGPSGWLLAGTRERAGGEGMAGRARATAFLQNATHAHRSAQPRARGRRSCPHSSQHWLKRRWKFIGLCSLPWRGGGRAKWWRGEHGFVCADVKNQKIGTFSSWGQRNSQQSFDAEWMGRCTQV